MVWIHGGALLNGANFFSNYGPNEFIKKDVILVSINYRLGAFGFLTLGDENVPGNMGLRDQNLAMQCDDRMSSGVALYKLAACVTV